MPERGDEVAAWPDGRDAETESTGPIVNVEQAEAWDGPSGDAWVARESVLNAALSPHTDLLFGAAEVSATDRVLDVGCGTGNSTRTAARRAVDGSVLGVDLSSAMLRRAREQAAAEGLGNVTFERADAQVHRFESGTVDLVLSRFGVMFFADPVVAFGNLGRATAPGGRLAAVVWQGFERNEWMSVPSAALVAARPQPPVPSDVPGPFGLAGADRTKRILEDAGWSKVRLTEAVVPYVFGPDVPSAVDHARQIGFMRAVLGHGFSQRIQHPGRVVVVQLAEHLTDHGVRFESRIWVVSAVR